MSSSPRKAPPLSKQIDVPPAWLFATLALAWLLDRGLPLLALPEAARPIGLALIVASLALFGWTGWAFWRGETPIHPRRTPHRLLTTGPFARSRNPIYLGMAGIALGAGLMMGSLGALAPAPAFVWVLQTRFIAGEEHYIEKAFGEEWRAYAARVRRWL